MSLETICVSDAELLKIAAPIMDNLMVKEIGISTL